MVPHSTGNYHLSLVYSHACGAACVLVRAATTHDTPLLLLFCDASTNRKHFQPVRRRVTGLKKFWHQRETGRKVLKKRNVTAERFVFCHAPFVPNPPPPPGKNFVSPPLMWTRRNQPRYAWKVIAFECSSFQRRCSTAQQLLQTIVSKKYK